MLDREIEAGVALVDVDVDVNVAGRHTNTDERGTVARPITSPAVAVAVAVNDHVNVNVNE